VTGGVDLQIAQRFNSVTFGAGEGEPEVKIVPPRADIPTDVAPFSGKWVGSWDGQLPTTIVVGFCPVKCSLTVLELTDLRSYAFQVRSTLT